MQEILYVLNELFTLINVYIQYIVWISTLMSRWSSFLVMVPSLKNNHKICKLIFKSVDTFEVVSENSEKFLTVFIEIASFLVLEFIL
jgi:hypothetical protein